MKRILFLAALFVPLFSCSPDESPEDSAAYEDPEMVLEPRGNFKSSLLESTITLGKDAELGYSVASNASYAFVGAPGYNGGKGAVLIYTKKGTSYEYNRIIEAPADMPAGEGRFGSTLSLTDNYLAIGGNAGGKAKGVAYLYVNNGADWTLSGGNLYPEGLTEYTIGAFGVSVSVSNAGYLVVGAPETIAPHPLGAGVLKTGYVFIYNIVNGTASLSQQDIRPEFITANSDFGRAVACYNDDVIVGAPNLNDARGGSFIYTRSGDWFTQTGGNETASTDFHKGSYTGTSVAIGNTYAMVGNGIGNRSFNNVRAVLIYTKVGADWKSFMASTSLVKGYGTTVATYGDRVMIGAPYVSRTKGAVFIFQRGDEDWERVGGGYLRPEVKAGDGFGSAISVYSETYLVGASGMNGSEGGVYSAVKRN